MGQVPENIRGVRFDEPFFDAAILRAGGYRTETKHTIPLDLRHVDYIYANYALELKILMIEPLTSSERQLKVRAFIKEEFPRGPLNVTSSKQEVRLSGSLMEKFWTRIVGTPIQRALEDAADQIKDTKQFIKPELKGAVLLVNACAESIDPTSFFNLTNIYRTRFSSIEAVFAFYAMPYLLDDQSPALLMAGLPDTKESAEIANQIGAAIMSEVEFRSGGKSAAVDVKLADLTKKPVFTFTQSGEFIRKPIR